MTMTADYCSLIIYYTVIHIGLMGNHDSLLRTATPNATCAVVCFRGAAVIDKFDGHFFPITYLCDGRRTPENCDYRRFVCIRFDIFDMELILSSVNQVLALAELERQLDLQRLASMSQCSRRMILPVAGAP